MIPIQNAVPSRYSPVVTWTLIATNSAVFLFQISLSPTAQELFIYTFALVPARYFVPFAFGVPEPGPVEYLPFLTNIFMHGGWLHLIVNMWMLWLFGGTVEDRLGHGRFLTFYLACGILASLAHAVFNATSPVPALGASGAIAGVMGCFVRLFPMANLVVVLPILFLPLFFEVPAIVFVAVWFLLQILQGTVELFTPATGGGVAWWAHIGGFLAGLALGPLLMQPERRYRTYYADEGILGFTPVGRR